MTAAYFKRILNLSLPLGQSAFLWGGRGTGKSTFLRKMYPEAIYYDLLKTDTLTTLMAQPHLLREELIALPPQKQELPIIIDEIQKIPLLLNEVHWLIENTKLSFILCGSSARKLKRGAANLLGGRAWRFTFYPLIYKEVEQFELLNALNHGLLPKHYLSDHPQRDLRAYLHEYIREEIQAEGLVRNLPGFSRFLDVIGFNHGEMVNYTNIARDCAIDAKTVKEYYQILVDTLLGYLIFPFNQKKKREIISATPKFYLFDCGVANYLAQRKITVLKGMEAGAAFEHFILLELQAFLGLNELDFPIEYWRSKSGLEVDFVINYGLVAIEVKISETPHLSDLAGLAAFCKDYQPKHAIVVCQAKRKRLLTTPAGHAIHILPWQHFLESLWERQYI